MEGDYVVFADCSLPWSQWMESVDCWGMSARNFWTRVFTMWVHQALQTSTPFGRTTATVVTWKGSTHLKPVAGLTFASSTVRECFRMGAWLQLGNHS